VDRAGTVKELQEKNKTFSFLIGYLTFTVK
jgi:hypothetical protein